MKKEEEENYLSNILKIQNQSLYYSKLWIVTN